MSLNPGISPMTASNKPKTDPIFVAAVILLCIGAIVAFVAIQNFDALPNYLRVASLVPLNCGSAMMYVDTWRNWSEASYKDQGRAAALTLTTVGLAIGSLIWWLVAPATRG